MSTITPPLAEALSVVVIVNVGNSRRARSFGGEVQQAPSNMRPAPHFVVFVLMITEQCGLFCMNASA